MMQKNTHISMAFIYIFLLYIFFAPLVSTTMYCLCYRELLMHYLLESDAIFKNWI